MIKFKVTELEKTAAHRPPEYLEVVLAAGIIENGFLWLDDEIYRELRRRFSGENQINTGSQRFYECKRCAKSRNQAFACELYSGCCFGAWRANPTNKCPIGKW